MTTKDDDVIDYEYLIEIQEGFIRKQMVLDDIMWQWMEEYPDEH